MGKTAQMTCFKTYQFSRLEEGKLKLGIKIVYLRSCLIILGKRYHFFPVEVYIALY